MWGMAIPTTHRVYCDMVKLPQRQMIRKVTKKIVFKTYTHKNGTLVMTIDTWRQTMPSRKNIYIFVVGECVKMNLGNVLQEL